MILFALFFIVVAFIVTFLINMAVFGSSGNLGGISSMSNLQYVLEYYLYQFIGLIVIVSIGFMISSAFRSGSLAIGLSISFLLAGYIITGLLSLIDKPWVKYILFMHLDLTQYINNPTGTVGNHPMSLGFSLAVLAGYFLLFNLVSWVVFRKRDIAA
jgi:ABC-2 type transport system permease protein